MNKWKPILVVALVFAAGVTLGVSGNRMMLRAAVRETLVQPDRVRERIELNLAWKLRLDPMQRRRLHQVVVESREQVLQLQRETQPRYLAIASNAQARINTFLNPAQQRQFEKLRAENRRLLPLGPLPPPLLPPRSRDIR
jgi:hypothetical protein